ncbi:hypothetical protein [Schaalia vaccimaxillae]|uniref:hypothetical protein n=1 Tax=Schaalia vaccimaxillae TaxID=183916 RepID=UPI0003B56586|nr:hypothetical protein [Schaalia vaccimaxillae]
MRVFTSLQQAQDILSGTSKWDRLFEAIEISDRLEHDVTYSVGDSLTWRNFTVSTPAAYFTTSRRYTTALFCKSGHIDVDIAQIWQPIEGYCDLNDRQIVQPTTDSQSWATHRVAQGALLLIDIHEAHRLRSCSLDFTGVQARITVEGRGFHNK